MESVRLGIVLDSSILIAVERRKMRPDQAIETVYETAADVSIVLSFITIAYGFLA